MSEGAPLFSAPVQEIIRKRSSWRSYAARAVESEKTRALEDFLSREHRLFWGSRVRASLVEVGPPGKGRVAGTYGMIKGAGTFLVGAVETGPRDMEDFGYFFEEAVLLATDLGLATCWMGATIRRGPFAEAVGLKDSEAIPAISPLGYSTKKRTLSDTVARATVSAARRKPWESLFFSGDFSRPLSRGEAGEWADPLEMVRLAPSATNKQPWRVVAQGGRFHFFLKRTPGYRRLTSAADMQRIDMGIAMCHFEHAARGNGLSGGWEDAPPAGLSPPTGTGYVVTWKA